MIEFLRAKAEDRRQLFTIYFKFMTYLIQRGACHYSEITSSSLIRYASTISLTEHL